MSFFRPNTEFAVPFKGRYRIGLICWWVGCCALAGCILYGAVKGAAILSGFFLPAPLSVTVVEGKVLELTAKMWWVEALSWWVDGIFYWLLGRGLLFLFTLRLPGPPNEPSPARGEG